MHDPDTLAFQINYPWWHRSQWSKTGRYHPPFITIWHHDPCRRGLGDDSCGWFMRAKHGDQAALERIVKAFEFDWDRVFKSDSGKVYYTGYFYPEDAGAGMPNMGVTAIVINLFFLAALEIFKKPNDYTRHKAVRFMQKNLFEIMLFAENPTDSLRHDMVRFWGTEAKRDERIRNIAACIYGWILREVRPWYRHPRWHIHHWQVQVHPWQIFKRRWIDRCCKCGKRFKKGEAACSGWSGTRIWHERCGDEAKVLATPPSA